MTPTWWRSDLAGTFLSVSVKTEADLVFYDIHVPPVVQGDDGTLTDVVSFYSVSSRVLNHPVHTSVRAARLFYVASTATELVDLVEDALVLAKSVSAADVEDDLKTGQ